MQELGLSENRSSKPGFLERYFSQDLSLRQRRFDWAFGVVLPIICIAADPLIFRSSIGFPEPFLAKFKLSAYLLSSVSIMAMAAWMLWGDRLGELRGYLSGFFLTASAAALVLGVVMIPLSLLGLIIGVGVLGFTPLFTSFIFLRHAVRAFDSAFDSQPRAEVIRAGILGALYGLVVPLVIQFS